MKWIKNSHPQNGFTLMEAILALALFSIVMISSIQVFSMGLQIWKRTRQVDRQEHKLLLALERMGQDIRNAVWISPQKETFTISDKSMKQILYKGTAAEVMIPSLLLAGGNKTGGFGRITYQWNFPKKTLCRKVEYTADLFKENKKIPCQNLVEDVWKVKFRYWLTSGISGSRSWYDEWESEDGLPEAIQVSIELKSEPGSVRRNVYEKTFVIPVAKGRIEDEKKNPPTAG